MNAEKEQAKVLTKASGDTLVPSEESLELKTGLDYLERIQEDLRRLSGIVDVIATLDGDDVYAHGVDFDNLAFAMKAFLYRIEDFSEELYDRLKDSGMGFTKLAKIGAAGETNEGRGSNAGN